MSFGFRGAFVLGLAMALIAAPCTTGFIAALFVEIGKRANVLYGFATFGMLALGMGLPFFFVGAFAMRRTLGEWTRLGRALHCFGTKAFEDRIRRRSDRTENGRSHELCRDFVKVRERWFPDQGGVSSGQVWPAVYRIPEVFDSKYIGH